MRTPTSAGPAYVKPTALQLLEGARPTTPPRAAEPTRSTLRLPPDLVRIARVAAGSRGVSVHAWVLGAIRAQALRQAADGDAAVRAAIEQP